jgi:hypothetical protein
VAYINPYRLFFGPVIPIWLLRRNEISPGAKLCYARLVMFSGDLGKAWPKQETLARELGVSTAQAGRYVRELEELKLIEIQQRGLKKSNVYFFLAHPWLSEVADMQVQEIPQPNADLALMPSPEVADVQLPETANMPVPSGRESLEENQGKEERSRPRGPQGGSARPHRTRPRKEPFDPESWKDLGALKEFLHKQDSVTDFPLPYFRDDRWWREIAKQVSGIQVDQVRRTFAFMAAHFLENPARRPVTKRGWLQKVRNLLVKQVELDNLASRRGGSGIDPDAQKERVLKRLEANP